MGYEEHLLELPADAPASTPWEILDGLVAHVHARGDSGAIVVQLACGERFATPRTRDIWKQATLAFEKSGPGQPEGALEWAERRNHIRSCKDMALEVKGMVHYRYGLSDTRFSVGSDEIVIGVRAKTPQVFEGYLPPEEVRLSRAHQNLYTLLRSVTYPDEALAYLRSSAGMNVEEQEIFVGLLRAEMPPREAHQAALLLQGRPASAVSPEVGTFWE